MYLFRGSVYPFFIIGVYVVIMLHRRSCHFYCNGEKTGCWKPPPMIGGEEALPSQDFYDVGSVVNYRCSNNDTQHLFGSRSKTCLRNGRWSGDLPYCDTQSYYNFELDGLQQNVTDYNTTTCIPLSNGFSSIFRFLEMENESVVLQIITNRNSLEIQVSYIHYEPGYIDNVTSILGSGQPEGEEGLYVYSYTFHDTSKVYNATASIDVKSCTLESCELCEIRILRSKRSLCKELEPRDNRTYISFHKGPSNTISFYGYGSAAVYSCQEGYRVVGERVRYCGGNDTWTGSDTFCTKLMKVPTRSKKAVIIALVTTSSLILAVFFGCVVCSIFRRMKESDS